MECLGIGFGDAGRVLVLSARLSSQAWRDSLDGGKNSDHYMSS